jgi:Holliday junction DNA helicase RuvA
MIARLTGTLVSRQPDLLELDTASGVGYAVQVPLSTFEALPPEGSAVTLLTELVVREDGWQLYGFATATERALFQRLLTAKGFGAALALGMLSALPAATLVAAIRGRDVVTLQRVPRVGKKKAEQLILDLADKLDALPGAPATAGAPASPPATGDEAVRAVLALGYAPEDAVRAVRAARDAAPAGAGAAEIIRAALQHLG